jgi:trimeric autotransporter adhesin
MHRMILMLAILTGSMAFAATAFASALAPTVVTGSAAAVTADAAVIGGTVTPNGAHTSYSFEYGTSASYGSQTQAANVRGDAGPKAVFARLKGLTPGTLYHFRLDATNSVGTTDGADQTFTTVSLPVPSVSTGSALSVTERSATLSGTVDPNGAETTYSFQYGATPSYGSQTPTRHAGSGTVSVSVSAPLGGLSAGTVYHYRLVATNGAGVTDGADQTFTTVAAAVPGAVTGTASSVTANQAVLAGTVTPNGFPTMYYFEYGATTGYGSRTSTRYAGAGSGSVSVAAHLFRLTPGQAYHFRLVAKSRSGTSDGADATFTTTSAPAPVVVTGPAVAVHATSADLVGTVDPNGSATKYSFQYGTTTNYGSQAGMRSLHSRGGNKTVMARANGLSPQTLYHYRLVATNSSGTTDGADQTFTTASAVVLPHTQWFAGSVSAVGSSSLTLGVVWTGPHDGSLNGQTLTVAVTSNTRIGQGSHNNPIALAAIQPGDLVAIRAMGDSSTTLTATRIHVYCNCHWVGGTISSVGATSVGIQVDRTGPYDTVLKGQNVTIQVNADTVYLQGGRHRRIGFGDLRVGQGVGVVFAADGFFKAPGFNPSTATFTAKRIHVWGRRDVPEPSSDAGVSAHVATG